MEQPGDRAVSQEPETLLRNVPPPGPRLVTVPRPGSPLAAVALRVAVGSADEEAAERGLAHVLEHLVVRSTLDGGRVGDGALVTARTDKEATVFSALVRAGDLPAAIATVGSVFRELRVPPETLAAELAAIREERRQRESGPGWRLQNAVLGALWAGTRAEHPVLGDPEVVDALTPDRVAGFHATWYRPAEAVLAVAADPAVFAPEDLAATAAQWPDPGGSAPLPVRHPARPTADAVAVTDGQSSGLGWVAAHADHPERIALACDAVSAAAGLRLATMPLRAGLCVWAMPSRADSGHAVAAVGAALTATRDRLSATDAASWLRGAATIPRLRAEAGLETLATRAADPRVWCDLDRLAETGPAAVSQVVRAWSERLASIDGGDRGLEDVDSSAH